MASLKIRGIGIKEIPYHKAVSLKKDLDNGTLQRDAWISIDSLSFKAGDISAITTDRVDTVHDQPKQSEKIDNDYYQDRRKFLALSVAEKAKNMMLFELFYQIMVDEHVPETIRPGVEKIQQAFFESNPYRMYCDPKLYRPVVPVKGARLGKFFHIIENIVGTDMDYQKYKLCN